MSDTVKGSAWQTALFLIACVYLIGKFFFCFFVPAHEYPMRAAQISSMLLDAGIILTLVGLRGRGISNAADAGFGPFAAGLFWVALLAGVGLFGIRLTSTAAWWTGHWTYFLLPR